MPYSSIDMRMPDDDTWYRNSDVPFGVFMAPVGSREYARPGQSCSFTITPDVDYGTSYRLSVNWIKFDLAYVSSMTINGNSVSEWAGDVTTYDQSTSYSVVFDVGSSTYSEGVIANFTLERVDREFVCVRACVRACVRVCLCALLRVCAVA